MAQHDVAAPLARYETARWARAYWWFGVVFSALAGVGLVAAGVVVWSGASIALVVIGVVWVALAVFAVVSASRLAWRVDVAADVIGYSGPRLHLSLPPAELLEVRPARLDIVGRGAHETITAQHGTIRLGPSRDVAAFFAALRQVNPAVRLPGDPVPPR
jgi:hypothetical protein